MIISLKLEKPLKLYSIQLNSFGTLRTLSGIQRWGIKDYDNMTVDFLYQRESTNNACFRGGTLWTNYSPDTNPAMRLIKTGNQSPLVQVLCEYQSGSHLA